MRRIPFLGILFFLTFSSSTQRPDSLTKLLDTILAVAKTQSYYTNKVNWPSLEKSVLLKAKDARNIQDLDSAFYLLLSSLGDFHGAVYYQGGSVEYRIPSGRKRYATQDSISSLIGKPRLSLASGVIDNYGYIRIPSVGAVGSEKTTRAANIIRDTICRLPAADLKGWIIDLRFNSGGNIYSMAAGLAEFLDEGQELRFINADGKIAHTMKMDGMNLQSNNFKPTSFIESCFQIAKKTPVAILVSRHTASSGETLAALLRQREHSIIIGEETSGYTTSTNYVDAMKMAAINITTAYPVDRNGKMYKSLHPDIFLQPDFNPSKIFNDSYMKKAVEWINNQIAIMYK